MADVAEGWVFAHYMRKAHYQRAGRTLCGKYGAFPASALEPDSGSPGPDDCAACRRKLDVRASTGRKPTRPQREFLDRAIEAGGEYEVESGTAARRLRATLLGFGWIADGRITDAGRQAVTDSGSDS